MLDTTLKCRSIFHKSCLFYRPRAGPSAGAGPTKGVSRLITEGPLRAKSLLFLGDQEHHPSWSITTDTPPMHVSIDR